MVHPRHGQQMGPKKQQAQTPHGNLRTISLSARATVHGLDVGSATQQQRTFNFSGVQGSQDVLVSDKQTQLPRDL